MIFYNWSGGMESSAMLVIDRERIRDTSAIVRAVYTGKQFPEWMQSKAQIEQILGLDIAIVPNRITFDEYLFEKGGMLRKGMNDCSRRMKRGNLSRHMHSFEKPYEVNLGFNAGEQDRADAFTDRNERDWLHWRYPLIESKVFRAKTVDICRDAGLSIVVEVYKRMGRMDCYFCPNQTETQALKVVEHYPQLGEQWSAAEERKGHSFMSVPLKVLVDYSQRQGNLFAESPIRCSCFGGNEDATGEDEEA